MRRRLVFTIAAFPQPPIRRSVASSVSYSNCARNAPGFPWATARVVMNPADWGCGGVAEYGSDAFCLEIHRRSEFAFYEVCVAP